MRTRHTFKLSGRLERGIEEIESRLAGGRADLTLDFGDVDFIAVDGLEWLEELLIRAESYGAKVSLVNLRPEQYKVLKVAHIDSLLAACGALANAGPIC